ncbi:probable peptidoglycan muropeptide transporter SLC46 [Drosophila sulfurigaster albostrigata]|uniref:probable peptidoglycan muropeptide transporter SLC46 n=1 Tax=Drosophila sulfurigaster albostrigata TaxID=89887 RepID=UPI002D21EB35|nr:probable peptidoglycan muropeptide transporter SLC46 [Drosophila sulfurigaster albostrigata]
MDEEPHAHENLVAAARRESTSLSSHSEDRLSQHSASKNSEDNSSQSPILSNEPTINQVEPAASPRSFLLEPMILVLLFAYNFSSTVLKSQIIYQSCTAGFGYSDAVCQLLGTKNATNETKRIEDEVQPYAAKVFLTIKIVECVIPAFCGLFVGAFADRYGRKPLLLASYLGYALQYLLSACIAYVTMQRSGMVSPWFYVLTILPLSFLGSSVTYSVAAVCFIGDVSTGKMRSYRMIAYELCIYVGLLLGSFASGYVYEATNAYIIFVISAGSVFFALFTMAVLLPESLTIRQQSVAARQEFMIMDLWRSSARRREFCDRSILILLICVLLLTAFVSDGSNSVFYMFMRAKFHWTVREFTNYETVSILVPAVAGSGGMLFLWSLRQCTKSAILWLAMISLLSHASSSLMKAFAFVDWQIYLAIGLGVFKSLVNPMCRTMITNLLPADERGKVFAMISVLQTLSPFVSSTLYVIFYTLTLSTAPSFFNLISANLFGLAIVLLLVVWRKKSENAPHYEAVFK